MYNWVFNGILASLNNKELLTFDNGSNSLHIKSTNWLLCWEKKRNVYLENERSWIQVGKVRWNLIWLISHHNDESSSNLAEVIKRDNILNFSFFYYFVLLRGLHSILSACHLSQFVTTAYYLFTEYFMSYLNIELFRNKTVHIANWH